MISFGVVFRPVSALSQEHDEGLDDKKNEELDIAVFRKHESGCVCGLFAGQKISVQFSWNLNPNPRTTRNLVVWQTTQRPANNSEFNPNYRRRKRDATSKRATRKRGRLTMAALSSIRFQ
jgi:hypothetical protein